MSLKDISEFLTIQETAQILQCHPDTVCAMIRRRELRIVRLGRAVRVVSDSVRALANQHTTTVPAEEVHQ